MKIPKVHRLKNELDTLRRTQGYPLQAAEKFAMEREMLCKEIASLQARLEKPKAKSQGISKAFTGSSWADCFAEELVDLGLSDPKYAGVFSPKSEIGRPKLGISEVLLSGAEEYFQRYQHFAYILSLLQPQFALSGIVPDGVAVDIGSGFGNTVIPLLETYQNLSIIATDLSPDLLAILRREADRRGVGKRCLTVAMDSQRDYFAPGFADHAFGCAVLHHLVDPAKAVSAVLSALKPGGRAIFLEPFETGAAILRLAYLEIFAKAEAENLQNKAIDFLKNINMDIIVRMHHGKFRDWGGQWESLDDKWLFTRSFFNRLRLAVGASDIEIRPIHPSNQPFTDHTVGVLRDYGDLSGPDILPDWAWAILKRYDTEDFSADMKSEIFIEGAVVITK